jgi:hypothetical protein
MINLISGMKFAVDSLGIEYSNVFTAFSFTSGLVPNTNILKSDSWATNASSGILNNTGSFSLYSGTGFFNGNTFIQLNKNYQLNNSTILISYEKLRHGNEILLSSVTGNTFNNYSGFYVGVNDANKLYLKYWNNVEGIFTFTYSKILSNKNLIIINKSDSIIRLGHYDNNTFEFEFENFLIEQNNFIQNDQLFVGGSPNTINWNNNLSNFSGYIDRLYIFNNTPFLYSNILAKGLYSEPSGFAGEFVETCFITGFLSGSGFSYTGVTGIFNSGFTSGIIKITGYANILSGYSYTGLTGYQKNIIGSYIDNCGSNVDIIETIPLSGLIFNQVPVKISLTGMVYETGSVSIELTGTVTGSQNTYVTKNICVTGFNITGDINYKYDNQYLSSLTYKEISLLSVIEENKDVVEIFTEDYQNKTLYYNKDLTFDNLNSNYFYIDKEFNKDEILMFANGQSLIDNGYQVIKNGYEIARIPNYDFLITGTTIETDKFFNKKDYLFYDNITGYYTGFKIDKKYFDINNTSGNFWIFKNGQKLIENKDYQKNGFIPIISITGENPNTQFFGQKVGINFNQSIIITSSIINSNPTVTILTGNTNNGWNKNHEITGFLDISDIKINSNGNLIFIGENKDSNGLIHIYSGNPTLGWGLKQLITGNEDDYLGQNIHISADGITLISSSEVSDFFKGSIIYFQNDEEINDKWIYGHKFYDENFEFIFPSKYVTNSALSSNREIMAFISAKVEQFPSYTYYLNIYRLTSLELLQRIQLPELVSNLSINNNGQIIALTASNKINIYSGNLNTSNWNIVNSINTNINTFVKINDNGDLLISSRPTYGDYIENNPPFNYIQGNGAVNFYKKNNQNNWILTGQFYGEQYQNLGKSIAISNQNIVVIGGDRFLNDFGSITVFDEKNNIIRFFDTEPEPGKNYKNLNNQINNIIIKEVPNNFNKINNIENILNTGFKPFNHKCSQVYYNGIKQKIGNNYIENSNFDLLSGNFYGQKQFQKVIYNNTDDFFV